MALGEVRSWAVLSHRRSSGAVAGCPAAAEIHVTNGGDDYRLTVFANGANGNVAPLRVIEGDAALLDQPSQVFADVLHDELYVANQFARLDHVYPLVGERRSAAAAQPDRRRDAARRPSGVVVDLVHDELVVSNFDDGQDGFDHRLLRAPRTATRRRCAASPATPPGSSGRCRRRSIRSPTRSSSPARGTTSCPPACACSRAPPTATWRRSGPSPAPTPRSTRRSASHFDPAAQRDPASPIAKARSAPSPARRTATRRRCGASPAPTRHCSRRSASRCWARPRSWSPTTGSPATTTPTTRCWCSRAAPTATWRPSAGSTAPTPRSPARTGVAVGAAPPRAAQQPFRRAGGVPHRGRRGRRRHSGRAHQRHRLSVVLPVEQRRDRGQGPQRLRHQQPVLGVRRRPHRRQRRSDRHRLRHRAGARLHQPAEDAVPADPGHQRVRELQHRVADPRRRAERSVPDERSVVGDTLLLQQRPFRGDTPSGRPRTPTASGTRSRSPATPATSGSSTRRTSRRWSRCSTAAPSTTATGCSRAGSPTSGPPHRQGQDAAAKHGPTTTRRKRRSSRSRTPAPSPPAPELTLG